MGKKDDKIVNNVSCGVSNQLPHLGDSWKGINRKTDLPRREFIYNWFTNLHNRLRDVIVASGDWSRVVKDSITIRHGLTVIFLDPPYDRGDMDYSSGGMGMGISSKVRDWCIENGNNKNLRIVLCGHDGNMMNY